MAYFIIDDSDQQFCESVCLNLANRGLIWMLLSDERVQSPDIKDKYLITSCKSDKFDLKSKTFVEYLRAHKFVKAFIFSSKSDAVLFKSELNGAIKELHVPGQELKDSTLSNFYISLFIELN